MKIASEPLMLCHRGYFSKQLGSQVAGSWNIMPNCILPNKSAKCSQVEVIANFCDGLHFINKEANRSACFMVLYFLLHPHYFLHADITQPARVRPITPPPVFI